MNKRNAFLLLTTCTLLASCGQGKGPELATSGTDQTSTSALSRVGNQAYPSSIQVLALPPGDFVTANTSATNLATALVGVGVAISNVSYTGSTLAAAVFKGGTGIIDFDAGVVLSTGKAADIKGPNNLLDETTDFGLGGDAKLTALAGQPTFDAAVLSFDFTPNADKVYFQYVFSSEEYDEFVGSQYNDVFAFYINGQNCATVGTPAQPVSINTINSTKNASLYRKNHDPAVVNTQMNGLTVTLTCQANVNPNVVNTISLRIADASDHKFDSAVLLKAGSFSTTPPDNSAPTAPGVPTLKTGSVTPNNTGTHTMTWAAATDAQSNALSYFLQHKNMVDADFSAAHSGALTTNEKTLAEAEGTWTYRVKANDGTVDGPFSGTSDPVKVDKTAPTAPSAAINGGAPTGTWYKDSAQVSFAGSKDPALADTSAGSGVSSYQGTQTFSSSGTFPYSGTATDAAGNVSAATSGSLKVDATAPSLTFTTCPSGPVVLNSAQGTSWTASDADSGLATPASGTVALTTTTVGTRSVSVTATDNVGHMKTTSCTYNVIYNFQGFSQPVDNLPAVNIGQAGRAYPVKFTLTGQSSPNVLAAGYPKVTAISCSTTAPTPENASTVSVMSNSGLNLDGGSYSFVWKTDKTPGCYQLNVRLNDNTDHYALFNLR